MLSPVSVEHGHHAVIRVVKFDLHAQITWAEALWMTVPYAIALVGLELVQLGTWLLILATGINIYGPMLIIGFGAVALTLVASLKALVQDRDWLSCLPVAVGAYALGFFYAPFVLTGAAVYLLVRGK